VQRSPTDCGALLCVIKKPRGRGGHSSRWAAELEKKIITKNSFYASFTDRQTSLDSANDVTVEERRAAYGPSRKKFPIFLYKF
jgi:hypothetical protein